MVERGQVLDDGKLRLEFLATTNETDGALHEMRARYQPRSPWPPAHHHPRQDEHFRVDEGRLLFRLGGTEHVVEHGQDLVIPRGVVHQVRNPDDVPAIAIWQTRPALRTGEFMEAINAAQTHGTLLDVAMTVRAFSDVFRLDMPPRPLTNTAIAAIAGLARLLRRQPPSPP